MPRFDPSRLALSLLAGCAQTDLVARHVGATCAAGEPCAGEQPCAQLCPALDDKAALCAGDGPLVLAGDGCGERGLPVTRFAVCSCSDFVSANSVTIDAFEGTSGNIVAGAGALGVNRDLSLPAATHIDGSVHVLGVATLRSDHSASITEVAAAPCQCEATQLLDIDGAIAAREQDHDNQSLGLGSHELDGFNAPRELSLPCGRYYFDRVAGSAKLTIRGSGNLALYVAGNVELDDALEISAPAGSQVSLFVGGELRVRGSFSLGGSPDSKGRAGLYADSRGTLDFGGSCFIAGSLYAPRAELVSAGTFELFGSLLVRRAAPGGELVVHHDLTAASEQACR